MKKTYYFLPLLFLMSTGNTSFAQDLENLKLKDKIKGKFENFFKGWKEAKPFQISGSLGLNMRSYLAFNTDNRQAPFTWNTNGNVNINIYKIRIPISVAVSAQNPTISHPFHREIIDNFADRRFVRAGASPYYKWVKLHVGHRSMNFSPFTVANRTYLGVGLELTPGKYRFAAFYGGMAKTEPRDLALLGLNQEIFNRKGLGVKMGYGGNKNFIDFILFKAKDDPNKIAPLNQDSTTVFQQDNAVLGVNAQALLFKKFNVKLEIASSGFTKNAVDPVTEEAQFPVPDFLLTSRTSTEYRKAINAGITYQVGIFSVGVGYKRIEPDFKSLGAYFFNDDLEDYTANLGFGLLKNKLRIAGTGGLQRNNIFGDKTTQLNRTIASANINYAMKSFTLGVSYSNYASQLDYVLNPELDSLNAIVITQSTSLTGSYSLLTKGESRHTFSATASLQQVTDEVEDPSRSAASQMINAGFNYGLSPKEGGFKINSRLNYNQNELGQMRNRRYGFGMGLDKKLVADIWSIGLNANYFYSDGETANTQTLNVKLNSPFRINKHHRINLSLLYLNRFKSENPAIKGDFQEITGTLGYTYSF